MQVEHDTRASYAAEVPLRQDTSAAAALAVYRLSNVLVEHDGVAIRVN